MALTLVHDAALTELADPVAPLEASPVVASLQQAIDAIEGAFLSAGDVLSVAVDGVGELIAGIDRLTAAIDPESSATPSYGDCRKPRRALISRSLSGRPWMTR